MCHSYSKPNSSNAMLWCKDGSHIISSGPSTNQPLTWRQLLSLDMKSHHPAVVPCSRGMGNLFEFIKLKLYFLLHFASGGVWCGWLCSF